VNSVISSDEEVIVFHIAEPDIWSADESYYKPDSVEEEGFIHLSTRDQVLATAHRYYAGRTDLVLLAIDIRALEKKVVYENLLGGEQLFPHYYAELPRKAVVQHAALILDSDKNFRCSLLD